jgi:3-oxoacyl-[acyl-carrier protein] reductase
MQVFIITGTRKGIGKNLATYYLEKGCIVAGCSRKESSISHQNYRHFLLDVADEGLVKNMVNSVKKEFGGVDCLINNAGIASMNHTLTTPYSSVKRIFSTNMFGTFLFVREVSKLMIRKKYGRIINFSTVAAGIRLEGEATYAASKSAIANFTQTVAKELGEFGITVNAIAPTPIKTDLIINVPVDKINKLFDHQAIKRFGEFKDIQNLIDFFIKDESEFITGQVIYLGGVNG